MTRVVLMDSDVKVTEDTSLINADFDIIILRFIINWIFFALLLCRTSTQNWHSELWNWVEYSRIIGQSFTKLKSQWMFWPKTIIFFVLEPHSALKKVDSAAIMGARQLSLPPSGDAISHWQCHRGTIRWLDDGASRLTLLTAGSDRWLCRKGKEKPSPEKNLWDLDDSHLWWGGEITLGQIIYVSK